MKKRVYNIKGKRLVEGDIDSITKEEMHVAINEDGKVELSAINDNGEIEKVAGASGGGAEGEYVLMQANQILKLASEIEDGETIEVEAYDGAVYMVPSSQSSIFPVCPVFYTADEINKYMGAQYSFHWAVPTSSNSDIITNIPLTFITPQKAYNIIIKTTCIGTEAHSSLQEGVNTWVRNEYHGEN